MAPLMAGGSSRKMRIGLIGAGRIGQVHCKAVAATPVAEVVVVADFFVKAAQACAEKFGIAKYCQDWNEVVQDALVDAVFICSPSDTHCDIIIAAARNGKHIFVEKPIDYELSRIDLALQEVAKANVKLQVGFQRRFDPNFMRVKKAMVDGEVGEPYMLSIISRDPAPPPIDYVKKSGGLLYDMAIHDMDMARHIMGCEAIEFSAMASSFSPEISAVGDVTTAVVTMRFENGAIGTIQCCRKAVYGYDQRIEVLGSNGGVEIGNNYPNTAVVSTAANISRDLPLNFFMERYAAAYANEIFAFVEAVVEDKPTLVTGKDGRIPVIMAMAAKKALDERRCVSIREVLYGNSKL
ncbi:putative oxidoreductase YrbE [Porphyridium purpureum]|uniref:Putative oxidoreductase YrbE n=1 Tax=Porphyridium purpureum TaxID=35688 RepID=A0A5J4Z9C6_PORPP|nr:putative oxidoreductase YrbE [Porphyridium purpureum]|eukprot:POR0012..scf295_1